VKGRFVSKERRPRRVVSGPYKGLVMQLGFAKELQMYLGLYERETHGWIKRLSRGIATGIDLGAAFGEFTVYFLKKTPAAKVYAFEPNLKVIPRLDENLALNGLAGTERMELVTRFAGTEETETEMRLDSLSESLQMPCFIKMDIDGGEVAVLKAATAINQLPAVRWLIETHSQELETECIEILRAAGFETRIVKNAWWRVILPEERPGGFNRWLVAWKAGDLRP